MALEFQTRKVVITDPEISDHVHVVCEVIKDGRWKAQLRSGLPDLDTTQTFDAFNPELKSWASRAISLAENGRDVDATRRSHLRRLRTGIDAPLNMAGDPTGGAAR